MTGISGRIQRNAHPINAGQVTLTDLGGVFGPYMTGFDPATGAFNFERVKVMPGGSKYQFEAVHGLYLENQTIQTLQPQESFSAAQTRLQAGDATNDGVIDLGDLTCIGGSFGAAPVACGTSGSSDLNADGLVNILDLVLTGGNYGLVSPGSW